MVDGDHDLRNEGIISLAAAAYEETKHPNHSYNDLIRLDTVCADYDEALDYARYLKGASEESAKEVVEKEWLPAARKLFKEHWEDIVRLAKVLCVRRKMTQTECSEIIYGTGRF